MADLIKVVLGFLVILAIGSVLLMVATSVVAVLVAGGGAFGGFRAISNYYHAFRDKMSFVKAKSAATL